MPLGAPLVRGISRGAKRGSNSGPFGLKSNVLPLRHTVEPVVAKMENIIWIIKEKQFSVNDCNMADGGEGWGQQNHGGRCGVTLARMVHDTKPRNIHELFKHENQQRPTIVAATS